MYKLRAEGIKGGKGKRKHKNIMEEKANVLTMMMV